MDDQDDRIPAFTTCNVRCSERHRFDGSTGVAVGSGKIQILERQRGRYGAKLDIFQDNGEQENVYLGMVFM